MTGKAGAIEVEVLFFARARDLAGTARARLELPAGATVAEAVRRLEEEFPGLGAQVRSCRIAVNEEFARGGDPVSDRSVLAVIPPVSGG
jgi:molybdopterin converting factor subunit 1